jgi:hypothetical protein
MSLVLNELQDMHRDAFADAPAASLPIKDRRGFPLERMPRLVAGSDVTDRPSCVFAVDCFGLSEEDLR